MRRDRQTDRQTEKHDTANGRFSHFPNRLEIGEKNLVEVASHDAIFPKKPIPKKKFPRIHTYTEVFSLFCTEHEPHSPHCIRLSLF